MRLLRREYAYNYCLTDKLADDDVPRYAILSHTWGADNTEVTFEDLVGGSSCAKAGFRKIKFCGEQAASDRIYHFWVDSCCIKKSSDAELSESINSMFRWYQNATKCYVYMSDVSIGQDDVQNSQPRWEAAFRRSKWFTRGWTLQELLAPMSVEFYSSEGKLLGDKESLEQQIQEITGIPTEALQGRPLSEYSVAERRSWARNRKTKVKEDMAYSLLGLFGIHMPLIYGEGMENAFYRLEEEIDKRKKSHREIRRDESFTVPFRRDEDFVDRRTLLDTIHRKCSVPGSWTALVGLGGVGKSQLAIEYAYRTRERSPETWVFWVHASNAARFAQGIRDISDVVKIVGRKDPKADIFKLVHDWLRESKRKWLIILDNVDDAGFLVNAQPVNQSLSSDSASQVLRPLRGYLPQSQNGSVLITTRSRESALKLLEPNDLIPVNPMDESNAIELLNKKLGPTVPHNNKDNVELVTALEFMPLAIVQAAAYISQLAPRYSVRQYIEEFQMSDRKKSSLLNHEGGQLRRDYEAKNSIIITWQISFEHICQRRQSAADLLSLMSFFDPQGIPEALVRTRTEVERNAHRDGEGEEEDSNDSQSEPSEDDGFEDDVWTLRNFSFLMLGADPTVFEMHKLVQLATWRWLEASKELEKWKQQYIKNLYAELPTGAYENWAKCAILFPHVQRAITQRPKERESLLQWASILYNGAWYAWQRGNVASAAEMSTKAWKTREKILGLEDDATLSSMGMLGLVYNMTGRWKEAEELEVQVMETRKSVLGQDHPSTLTSMANLASTYRNQGRWKEAEELDVQVMETYKSVLGQDHPSTLTSIANLASTFCNQGRWKEAEELGVQVMETSKSVLGQDHPSTLTSIANLASTYRNQGRWKEAEELQANELDMCKRVLGQNHPDTLISMANLASTYRNQGRWKEAEELQANELDMCKRVLGQNHPDTLISMANLALIFNGMAKEDDAIALMQECYEKRKQVIGLDHPFTKASEATLNQWHTERLRLDSPTERSRCEQ